MSARRAAYNAYDQLCPLDAALLDRAGWVQPADAVVCNGDGSVDVVLHECVVCGCEHEVRTASPWGAVLVPEHARVTPDGPDGSPGQVAPPVVVVVHAGTPAYATREAHERARARGPAQERRGHGKQLVSAVMVRGGGEGL
jgi:hypothetical protein